MKIITIEEHYMSEKVNDRFMELNQPKDEVQANQEAFVKLFMQQGTITDIGERRIAFMAMQHFRWMMWKPLSSNWKGA
jgi:hypothetical protein